MAIVVIGWASRKTIVGHPLATWQTAIKMLDWQGARYLDLFGPESRPRGSYKLFKHGKSKGAWSNWTGVLYAISD